MAELKNRLQKRNPGQGPQIDDLVTSGLIFLTKYIRLRIEKLFLKLLLNQILRTNSKKLLKRAQMHLHLLQDRHQSSFLLQRKQEELRLPPKKVHIFFQSKSSSRSS